MIRRYEGLLFFPWRGLGFSLFCENAKEWFILTKMENCNPFPASIEQSCTTCFKGVSLSHLLSLLESMESSIMTGSCFLSWLPNQMISLILIFGFLCRSSIWYPDDYSTAMCYCFLCWTRSLYQRGGHSATDDVIISECLRCDGGRSEDLCVAAAATPLLLLWVSTQVPYVLWEWLLQTSIV